MKLYQPQDGLDPRELARNKKEIWVPLVSLPEIFVSNLGCVFDVRQQRELSTALNNGYPSVLIRGKGRFLVHRLVLEAFDGSNGGKKTARCLGEKDDPRLCNWIWASTRGILTQAEKDKIDRLLDEGISQAEIARLLNMSSSHVNYYAKKHKVQDL